MKILIIHGPNTNLLGIWSSKNNSKVTLNKVNQHIRKYIRNKNISIKIIQTNKEDKIVSYVQKNRKKIDKIILMPGIWQKSAYVFSDLLLLLSIPFITIAYKKNEKVGLLNGLTNIYNNNIYLSFEQAIERFINE